MIEDTLSAAGYSPEEIAELAPLLDRDREDRAIIIAGEFIHRVLLRLERDSLEGRALARALGFTNGRSLERAAGDFCVSKQYLQRIEAEYCVRLRGLAVSPAPKITGPSTGSSSHRNQAV